MSALIDDGFLLTCDLKDTSTSPAEWQTGGLNPTSELTWTQNSGNKRTILVFVFFLLLSYYSFRRCRRLQGDYTKTLLKHKAVNTKLIQEVSTVSL